VAVPAARRRVRLPRLLDTRVDRGVRAVRRGVRSALTSVLSTFQLVIVYFGTPRAVGRATTGGAAGGRQRRGRLEAERAVDSLSAHLNKVVQMQGWCPFFFYIAQERKDQRKRLGSLVLRP
jgi:hypothetical protein